MRPFEFGVALLLTALGVRSMVHWGRRPFESTAIRDQMLYAVYLTGRVGMWFAFAGVFYLFAFVGASDPAPDPITGELVVEHPSTYAWYVIVFAVLGAMQLLAGWFLGHGGPVDDDDGRDPPRGSSG
jgi:hypothetical protein